MAIPDFQTLMLPTMKVLADGNTRSNRDLSDAVAASIGLSAADQAERMGKWSVTRWSNRMAWVMVHLKFARLVERPARGTIRITDRGLQLLATQPDRIDLRVLQRYPEYSEARTRKKESGVSDSPSVEAGPDPAKDLPPLETINECYRELRGTLAEELLDAIKGRSPEFFERLVLQLMQKLGYGGSVGDSSEHVGGSGDGGVDGLIREDRLGLDVIYLQAKRWESPVGAKVVREFLGALDQAGAKKGVLITTSTFTKDARQPLGKTDKKISLIDGASLAELMIDHDLGVALQQSFQVKKIDSDFFEDE